MEPGNGRTRTLAAVLLFVFFQASVAPVADGTVTSDRGVVADAETDGSTIAQTTVARAAAERRDRSIESTHTVGSDRSERYDVRNTRTRRAAFAHESVSEWRTGGPHRSVSAAEAAGGDPLDEGVRAIRADRVHERGVTGEGVRVGVIGEGFDADHDALADRVADSHRIDGARGDREHGTAVAGIVAETAPNATLYLAAVGDRPTAERYRRAIEWSLDNDVDVIVDSGSYFPRTTDDADRITDAAERASAEGVVFVTSAGNYADRHWAGDGARRGWVTFANGTQANFLDGGNQTSGAVSLRLQWNSTADYDLYLYRLLSDADAVTAKSTRRQTGDTRRSEAIDVMVPPGRYYAAVHAHNVTDDPGAVSLFSPHKSLKHHVANGSVVAPGTSNRVISVAAVDHRGRPYDFSSRGGPMADVDVGAPGRANATERALTGTSAAAPYVAGTAALMVERNGSLTPAQVEYVLERSAVENGGRLDALAATTMAARDPPARSAAADATDLPDNATAVDGADGGSAGANESADGSDGVGNESTDGGTQDANTATPKEAGDGNDGTEFDPGSSDDPTASERPANESTGTAEPTPAED